MSRVLFHPALLALFCTACGDKNTDSGSEDGEVTDTEDLPDEADLTATLAFEVPERPYDLAVDGTGRIYCSAQAGGKVYAWDPLTDDRDEVAGDFSDVLALSFQGETLYMTASDNGVTGGLYRLDTGDAVELATQDDAGTLMRSPADLIADGSGGWLIADDNAGVVFHVAAAGAVTSFSAGSAEPLALSLSGGTLTIGGDDGIWSMSWPGGSAASIDSRAGLGLLEIDGQLWAANASEGLFVVGGGGLGIEEAARPASMVEASGVVYLADRVGQGVWAVTP